MDEINLYIDDVYPRMYNMYTMYNKNMKLHKNPQSTDKARTLSLIFYILYIIIYKWNPNQSESNEDFSAYIQGGW